MARSHASRYSAYRGGPDPLAPPVDLAEALEEIGRDVMEGTSPRRALQELLRRGMRERRGLDELTREVWRRRSELQRDNRLDGTLQQVRELLQRALDAERDALGRDDMMIVVGGVIPAQDFDELRAKGADAIYPPGTVIPEAAIELLQQLRDRLEDE